MPLNQNVLITGGAGFIGSNLALKLVTKGYQVTVLDNLSKQIHGDNAAVSSALYRSIAGKVNFIHGSVTSAADLKKAIRGQDMIVHLAAETGTGQSMYKISHYVKVNVGGTAALLHLLTNTKHSVQKVVVASSRSIYGEGKYRSKGLGFVYPQHRDEADMTRGDFEVKYPGCQELLIPVATDEASKIHPSSVYGITKHNQEQMVLTVCKAINIKGVALRYQNVYGPGQSLSNPYTGILSIFSSLIKGNEEINIFEDGKESRDFVFIDDVVNATILALENDNSDNQVFNVGTGVPIDVISVVNELAASYGVPVRSRISGNYRLGDIRHNFADITKISQLLGFKPATGFKEGIKQFTDWVNQQEPGHSKYKQSINEMRAKGLLK